jgi:hypothetical protein
MGPTPSSSLACPSSPALTSRRCWILAIVGLLEPPLHHTQPHSSLLLLPPSAMDRGHAAPPPPIRPRCWPLHRPPPRATSPLHLLMPPPVPWIEAVMHLHIQWMLKGRGIMNRRLPPNIDPLGTLHSFSSSTSKAPIFWPTNSDIMEG